MSEQDNIENLLRAKSSARSLPDGLRANVLDSVSNQLQRKTFFDDLKLVCACAGVLFVVCASLWISMENDSRNLQQLTNSKWDSTKGHLPMQPFSLPSFDNSLATTIADSNK